MHEKQKLAEKIRARAWKPVNRPVFRRRRAVLSGEGPVPGAVCLPGRGPRVRRAAGSPAIARPGADGPRHPTLAAE
ncbi:hypothetical protein GCM10010398_08460 [Streptomyces fimbriatus]